jgi:hypothetical protein
MLEHLKTNDRIEGRVRKGERGLNVMSFDRVKLPVSLNIMLPKELILVSRSVQQAFRRAYHLEGYVWDRAAEDKPFKRGRSHE